MSIKAGIVLSLVGLAGAASAAIPLDHFARQPEFDEVSISPDGRYIAATVPDGNQTNLAVIRLADMKVTAAIQGGRDLHVSEIHWASATRVVVAMADSDGPLDNPRATGELMAVDVDGSKMAYIFGWRPPSSTSALSRRVTAGFGRLVSSLRGDDRHVLVSSLHPREAWLQTGRASLYRLNVDSAATTVVARAPIEDAVNFVVDDGGTLHFAVGRDRQTLATRTYRYTADGDWQEIGSGQLGAEIIPIRISGDGERVYVRARDAGNRYCLAELDTVTAATRPLSCNDIADLGTVVFSADGNVPLAAYYQPDQVVVDWLNPKHPEAIALRRFAASFPGQAVVPVSRTKDGTTLVLHTYSDRNPGDFYLYDTRAGKAQYLFSSRGWVDPKLMAQRRPIRFKARDGVTIHGYLTLPENVEAKDLPLIVHPHGGPFGVRDGWGWQPDAQALASRGYAVLQVNFRGSGGYGHAYHEAARGQWGGMMIDDITDGVRWVVGEGIADVERICAYGGSYGGYASLMSAVREPDLYKCTVGYVGVYDIPEWMKDTDVKDWKSGRNYMRQYVGDDAEDLAAQSPIRHLERLTAPVFIVHGKLDRRVPYNQATLLRSALEKRQHPYEWMEKPDEGHGFYRKEARVELYERLFSFFDKHIGASK